MKPLTQTLENLIEKIFIKKHGPAFAKIFVQWTNIVGTNLAGICTPIIIDKFDKILIVGVFEESEAIKIYFMQDIIIERINNLLKSKKIGQTIHKLHVKKYHKAT